ncbi:ABC-type sulfate transport system permease component [Roseovarius sp. MBR-79]|jgi:putative spermidine/putrescine transport system permease protein
MRWFILAVSLALLGVLGFGLVWPLVTVARVSIIGAAGEITFETYGKVFGNAYFMRALVETVLFCLATSALASFWALPLAWRIGRGQSGARTLRALSQINFAFAGIIYGMLMIVLMGNAGVLALLEAWLLGSEATRGLAFTAFGLAVCYLSFQIPRSALILAEAVAKIDPGLLDAARTLGGRGPAQAWLVVLPLLRPALVEATVFSFLLAMASFGPALLIARSITIFPALIYREFTGFLNFPNAAVMAVLMLVVALVLSALMRLAFGRPSWTETA